jgi:hypothetical protein
MDLSAKPKTVKIDDFNFVSVKPIKDHTFGLTDAQAMSTFPIGPVTKDSKIFIFSVSCGSSVDQFIKEIVPRIQKGEPVLLANMLRHDADLNVWTRIFKLKSEYRMGLVTKIYKETYDKKGLSMDGIHKVIDRYLSSVPLEKVYSGYSLEQAAVSGILTSFALRELYNVTATPVFTRIK